MDGWMVWWQGEEKEEEKEAGKEYIQNNFVNRKFYITIQKFYKSTVYFKYSFGKFQ